MENLAVGSSTCFVYLFKLFHVRVFICHLPHERLIVLTCDRQFSMIIFQHIYVYCLILNVNLDLDRLRRVLIVTLIYWRKKNVLRICMFCFILHIICHIIWFIRCRNGYMICEHRKYEGPLRKGREALCLTICSGFGVSWKHKGPDKLPELLENTQQQRPASAWLSYFFTLKGLVPSCVCGTRRRWHCSHFYFCIAVGRRTANSARFVECSSACIFYSAWAGIVTTACRYEITPPALSGCAKYLTT